MIKISKQFLISCIIMFTVSMPAYAWSNGGYSADPNNPKYGTHDFILKKSIDMLPQDMQGKIDIVAAYYGSEIPDCTGNIYCKGDVVKHHVYYYKDGRLQDDASATRAQQEYDLAKSYLEKNDVYSFSLHVGAMSHYISDLSVFGHTMGVSTDWGSEIHHSDYEDYVDNHLNDFGNIVFDGKFDSIYASNAAIKIAYETTFDSGTYTNVWMDKNYDWSNPNYKSRTQYIINYNVNILSDTIYTLISSSKKDILSYYRGLTGDIHTTDTQDLLKAADDWRNNVVPPGYTGTISTTELLTLADEWSTS